MDENKFWMTIWKLVAAVVMVLILTIGGCVVNQQRKIAELIVGGADPIKAHCAIVGVASNNAAVCGMVVVNNQGEMK